MGFFVDAREQRQESPLPEAFAARQSTEVHGGLDWKGRRPEQHSWRQRACLWAKLKTAQAFLARVVTSPSIRRSRGEGIFNAGKIQRHRAARSHSAGMTRLLPDDRRSTLLCKRPHAFDTGARCKPWERFRSLAVLTGFE